MSKHTTDARKAKYGGMDVSVAQEAKQLRDENSRLKKLVVDLSLDKEMLPSWTAHLPSREKGAKEAYASREERSL